MKKYLAMLLSTSALLFLAGCGNDNETFVDPRDAVIPIDTNIAYAEEAEPGHDPYVLYYADPRPEENGENRVLRVEYRTWKYRALPCSGINPHSIDRAGRSEKFYIRTQNSYSFDVVNFETNETKTVSMEHTYAEDGQELYHKPRAIGAYNDKYKIQLLSVKNRPAADVIDVATDKILTVLGDNTSTVSSGSATGHSFWLDEDHCGVIDRVNNYVWLYRVDRDEATGALTFTLTQKYNLKHPIHVMERVEHARNEKDLYLFYATYEGDLSLTPPFYPAIAEFRFDPFAEKIEETRVVEFPESDKAIDGIAPVTHHVGISPDGRYMIAPDYDGKVYIVDRETYKVVKTLQAGLGAAHVNFSEPYDVAIVTSHYAPFVTIIDMKTLTVRNRVTISHHTFDPTEKHLLQPHFSYVDPDGRYFYTFATQDGDFVKIDLETDEVVERLHTGGAPEQAHS